MGLILQLDQNGQPIKWVTWQEATIYYAKELVTWELGTDRRDVLGGMSRMTGEQSKISTASIIAVKGIPQKYSLKPPLLSNKHLFRRDWNLCGYCGKVFTDGRLTRDHIIPKSRGGQDIWTNVVTACAKCNQKKDARTPQEANMELLYVPYVPSKAEHLILANRNILFDQQEFLLSFVDETSRLRDEIKKHSRELL